MSLDSEEQLMSIESIDPKFKIQEPKQEKYKFVIKAFNDKGESQSVVINQEDIENKSEGELVIYQSKDINYVHNKTIFRFQISLSFIF